MVPPSYIRVVVNRNFVMRHMTSVDVTGVKKRLVQHFSAQCGRATRWPTSDVIYLEFLVQAATKVKRITRFNRNRRDGQRIVSVKKFKSFVIS
jgi:hypothetical protein